MTTNDRLYKEVNDVYSIFIGPSENNEAGDITTYKITNMVTNVVEAETTILPRALAYSQGFYEDLRVAGDLPDMVKPKIEAIN